MARSTGLKAAAASTLIPAPSSPALDEKVAAACAERGVRFLDAPVTGGDWGAREGKLVFMIGGDAETIKEVEPVLGVMGKKWFHLGPQWRRANRQARHERPSGFASRRDGGSVSPSSRKRA